MKRITVISIVITGLLIAGFAATKFLNKEKISQPFSMIGEWEMDSLAVADSSSLMAGLLSHFLNERGKISYHFLTDSVVKTKSPVDSTTDKYYLKDTLLYLNEGDDYQQYVVRIISDSLIQLRSKDSSLIVLKKR